jgi:hypothetical protein
MSARVADKQPEGKVVRAWRRPELKPVGSVGDVLKGGGGKLTVVTGDPGEPQKVPGMDK